MTTDLRVYLSPREFSRLEMWVAVADGKHKSGGMQGHRRRWRAQLDARRGHLSPRARFGPTAAEERWIDLDEGSCDFVRNCIQNVKKGGWQRDIRDIFGGCEALTGAAS
jgi:hypothetical protein